MVHERHIAILGGGAAGLTAAYFLHDRPSADRTEVYKCTVFEVSERLGGNCHSAYLGQSAYQEPFCDLGVNDFNTARYSNFMAVLAQLECDGFHVSHAPLLDTTSWSTPREVNPQDARSYTDLEMAHWADHPEKPWLRNIAKDWDAFQRVAKKVLAEERFARMNVDEFISSQGYSYDFAEYNLRARINGMYYVNDSGPGLMPIRAVMKYYHLQEGIGEEKSTKTLRAASASGVGAHSSRHYFIGGASAWIRQLTRCLKERGVEFRLGASPVATLTTPAAYDGAADAKNAPSPRLNAKWSVTSTASGERTEFDHVISAVHADFVGRVIDEGLTPTMITSLSHFDYYNSIAIVHDDDSLLPADKTAWSTYNILVYPPRCQMLRPYTINYVARKHQGEDSNRPPYVTLTPYDAVANEKVREMLRLPQEDRVLAVAYFRHNTLTWQAIEAQETLHREQGVNGLWFTGGWTNGAGLHEEVIAMSKEIALHIRGIPQPVPESYQAGRLNIMPKHVSDSFDPDSCPFPDHFWDRVTQL